MRTLMPPRARDRTKRKHVPDPVLSLGPLPTFVGYWLRRAQLAVSKDFTDTMAVANIRTTLFPVLVVIDANPGLRQTQVAQVLGLQPANVVPVVDELEREGLAK